MNPQPKRSRFTKSRPLVRKSDVNARSCSRFLSIRAVAALLIAYFLALFLFLETRMPSVVVKEIISPQKESLAALSEPFPPKQIFFVPYSSDRVATRGAYTSPPRPFHEHKTVRATKIPIEAFLQNGFKQVDDYKEAMFFWYRGWDKIAFDDSRLKPWQRPNWTPGMSWMALKDPFLQVLERSGIKLSFFPESYRLCDSNGHQKFLDRLEKGGGMHEAWVMKVSNSGRSAGITMLGPNSKDLANLRAKLTSREAYEQLCRKKKIIQKYVTNLLTYEGRKCNLRAFFPVVSVENPLVVYYHDGYLHTSRHQYNETDFTGNIHQHLSQTTREWDETDPKDKEKISLNSSLFEQYTDAEVSYEDFGRFLTTYVKEEAPHLQHTIPNPLAHIRNQMKAQMVDIIHAFRNVSFTVCDFAPENAYILMGNDFFVDKDLNVIFIESNWFAGTDGACCAAMNKTVNRMLPEMVDLVSEVYEKQLNGEAVLPLKKVNRFELVYTD